MEKDFWPLLLQIIEDPSSRAGLANNLKILAKPDATEKIVDEILKTILK